MFKFIFKNAMTKKSKILLTAITIIIACVVGILSVNISQQVKDGIIKSSDGYDVVIGPSGSDSQLAFNALFFSEDALGTVDYNTYLDLKKDRRIQKVIPFAMADSYGSYRLLGTTPEFLENNKINGETFNDSFECVIGYNVAKNTDLEIGKTFFSTHGASMTGVQHNTELKVVGILAKTNSNYDNIIFTKIDTIWNIHGMKVGEIDEDDDGDCGITSLLVKTKSMQDQSAVIKDYSSKSGMQAITPTIVLRKSLSSIDMSKQIVYALTAIIFVMSIILLFIITLLSAQDTRSDIKLMRYIGISGRKTKTIFIVQSAIMSFISIIIAFILAHFGLNYVNNISTGYGIVIDCMKVYTNEYYILAIMFIVTIIPTYLFILKLFKKDITKI